MDRDGRPFNRQRRVPFNNTQLCAAAGTPKKQSLEGKLGSRRGSLVFAPPATQASITKAEMKRPLIPPSPHPLSVAISVSQTGWTADFMAVTASNHGGLTGFAAPTAQSVHFDHSPFSQALAWLQQEPASSVFHQKQR